MWQAFSNCAWQFTTVPKMKSAQSLHFASASIDDRNLEDNIETRDEVKAYAACNATENDRCNIKVLEDGRVNQRTKRGSQYLS